MVLSVNFLEWFRGFTDAEGCFTIVKIPNRQNSYQFIFKIEVHLTDKKALDYIYSNLKIGKISVNLKTPSAIFKITRQTELKVLSAIFNHFPLNTTKYLDFLSFEQAFRLYTENSSRNARKNIHSIIESARGNMNTHRIDFNMPTSSNHFKVTRNWLLGFVEGDGTFFYTLRDKHLVFSITQKGNEALLHAIKDFLINLAGEVNLPVSVEIESAIKIYTRDKIMIFRISDKYFLEFVLIPFFDRLTWHSKKYLDYCDWKVLLELQNLGLHLTSEGKVLINRIISQMNNKRLSLNSQSLDRSELLADIREVLKQPSNYENKEGRIFINSLKVFKNDRKPIKVVLMDASSNKIIQSFVSYKSCGKFLGLHGYTVNKRASSGAQFTHDGILVYLKKDIS